MLHLPEYWHACQYPCHIGDPLHYLGKLNNISCLQYLFNIAGVMDLSRSDLLSVDTEKMLHCFTVNAVGPLLTVQQLLLNGLLGNGTTIANMTSKMGSIADNSSGGAYAYRASKAALNQISKSMSIDLKDQGMTVVILHPGEKLLPNIVMSQLSSTP